MTRTEIYNNEVMPLITKAYAICDANDIPFISVSQLDDGLDADGEEAYNYAASINIFEGSSLTMQMMGLLAEAPEDFVNLVAKFAQVTGVLDRIRQSRAPEAVEA